METLQEQIATCFPDAYAPDTWKDLLPRFIALQLDQYHQQIDVYDKEHALWEISDHSATEPIYPVLPIEFAQACELQAQIEGLDLRALACCLYIGRRRTDELRQQYQHVYQLCGEFSETSLELRQAYLDLKNCTKAGKWLN